MTRRGVGFGVCALPAFACCAVVALVMSAHAQTRALPAHWVDIGDAAPPPDALVVAARAAAARDAAAGGGSFWIGYTFALREGVHIDCDGGRGRGISFGADDIGFRLPNADDIGFRLPNDDDEWSPLCDDDVGLFVRFEDDDDELTGARMMSLRRAASRLDEPVVWAGEIDAATSAAWLRSAVLGGGNGLRAGGENADRTRRRLLSALAVHDSGEAVEVVLSMLDVQHPSSLREAAVFWAAQLGGDAGLRELIDLARNDRDAEVRKQSIFWLAQVAGERATQHLADIAADDPDAGVRQSAVFALSQSEDDAAIESLIEIVRTHDNREVVKSALFWLGQSGDARAVALIEELLLRGMR